jgi:hypothetical protein
LAASSGWWDDVDNYYDHDDHQHDNYNRACKYRMDSMCV